MKNNLYIALVHLNVRYKDMDTNIERLLELNRMAAQDGHKIILNTEMALPGYSFQSREEILPFTCTTSSKPVTRLASIAYEYKVFICMGLALQVQSTNIFHNAALVIGPDGNLLLSYHKINAEARWACPGDPLQENIFSTPWGKIGVLICSDSYHGLLVRQTALKGADLILVPANWPPSGLDPVEVWSIRARENRIYIAACNRTGTDRIMDCTKAPSGVFSPDGEPFFCETSNSSSIISTSIPLENNKICTGRRDMAATRRVHTYGSIYLDMRYAGSSDDMTSWHGLNAPEPFQVIAYTALDDDSTEPLRVTREVVMDAVLRRTDTQESGFTIMIFPQVFTLNIQEMIDELCRVIHQAGLCICFSCRDVSGEMEIVMAASDNTVIRHKEKSKGFGPGPDGISIVDAGPARIGICLPEDLLHPETGIAHAKLGCDILVSSLDRVEEKDRLVMAGRSLDKTGIAVSAGNLAFICLPPKGHARFKESVARSPHQAEMIVDPAQIREKIFQDRVDYNTLLSL